MPRTFVTLGQNDIILPSHAADPTGLSSYEVISDTLHLTATPPDYESLRDIVRVGLCGVDMPNRRCASHKFRVNNAASRWMINVLLINENGVDVVPGDMHFVIRQSSSCIPTVRFDGLWEPSNDGGWAANGLLLQIGGMLSTSVEVQAEIRPNVFTPAPSGYSIVFQFIFDRIGDTIQTLRGPNTTGTSLPPFP